MSSNITDTTRREFKTLRLKNKKLEFYNEIIRESSEPQLVIKPKLVGICRSDIKEFLGTRTVRHDFGHEILGEVVSNNDSRLQTIGSTVVLDPHVNIRRSSGFGELVVASGSADDLLAAFITVPHSTSNDRLVFVEPLACAHHCVANLLRFEHRVNLKDVSVGIVGAGMTGVLIGLLCRGYGADVTIINRHQERLNFLEETSIFPREALCTIDNINKEFDVIIPTTTFLFPEILELCERIVKERGTILLYGGTKQGDVWPGSHIDIDRIRREQLLQSIDSKKSFKICGTHGAATEDFKSIGNLLNEAKMNLPVEKLISHRISLDELPPTIIKMTNEDMPGKTIVVL